jgi:hypothetical protein
LCAPGSGEKIYVRPPRPEKNAGALYNPRMREEELRDVLLVRAIEETDRDGALIPPADRAAASREAKRAAGEAASEETLLAARARILLPRIVARHPFVDTVLDLARGPAWAGWGVIVAGLLLGATLSALDGTRRINVLAFPLLGLILWNLAVYIAFAYHAIRARGRAPLPGRLARFGIGRAARLIGRAATFDKTLAEALRRFVADWSEAARPLLVARARRVFHLGAAAVGVGLIAGLYVRGMALDYQAGWESTFLDASGVHRVLAFLFAPASFVTGIPIPDAAHLEAMRWQEGRGGERAAPWLHLLAASVAVFVVAPRVLLALIDTAVIARRCANTPMPAALVPYFRASFSAIGGAIDRGIVMEVPYAYEPAPASLATLRTLLPTMTGARLAVDSRAPVAYGAEEEFLAHLGDRGGDVADVIALLFNLAATPEDENHGTMIAGTRDWLQSARPRAQLLVLVDEGPYAARMSGAPERVAERREAWRAFIAARGIEPKFVDLAKC